MKLEIEFQVDEECLYVNKYGDEFRCKILSRFVENGWLHLTFEVLEIFRQNQNPNIETLKIGSTFPDFKKPSDESWSIKEVEQPKIWIN